MAHLSIHLLGPFQVTLDGEPLTGFESNKVRALLAYLAVEADHPHSRGALAGCLWPDQAERSARRNLSQALFNLRQVIHDRETSPPFLKVNRQSVQLDLQGDCWLDVTAFKGHIAASQRPSPDLETREPHIEQLERAVALYRGEFLAGLFVDDSVPFSEWATLLRERLHRQVLDALYHLTAHYERRRDYARAYDYARRQVELEPWREEAHQQLMRLLARSGQRSAALHQYELCRQILADQLGVAPSEETRRLYGRLRQISELGAHNLPPQMTPFVGRQAELITLGKRLPDPACRLLTLLGPGGIGKTRLAIQAAYENRRVFLHGVCFVPLATLPTAASLASAVADALKLRLQGSASAHEQVLDALRPRELLLVLDNFEHLVEDGAWLLADILHAAPDITLLVTSRERLNLYAETVFDVQGLECPAATQSEHAASYSAVNLFLRSADRARAGFVPAAGEMNDIVRICRLTEGMPLGIELAAAGMRAHSCREIADQIQSRLAFLSASARDVPPRHHSVQAAFDHSWQRLPAEEQSAFAALSVFRDGFDGQAAAQVAGASSLILTRLGDQSFVNRAPNGRYDLHALMRQYGAEKLACDPPTASRAQDAHCQYYAQFVQAQFKRFQAGQQRQALDAIATDLKNVRAAWEQAIGQGQYNRIKQMMGGLYTFCIERAVAEGDKLFERAAKALQCIIARQVEPDAEAKWLWGELLWRWGAFHYRQRGAYEQSEALLRQSIALLRPSPYTPELALALCTLGTVLRDLGRCAEARQATEEGVALIRQRGSPYQLSRSLTMLAGIMATMTEYAAARQLLQESLALCREWDNQIGLADSLANLGNIAYRSGDYVEAQRLYLESQALYEELGEFEWANVMRSNLGHACQELGQYAAAGQHLREALQTSLRLSQGRFSINVLHGLAEWFEKQGHNVRAYEMATFVAHHTLTFREAAEAARQMAESLKEKLSPEVAAAAEARARTWTLDEAVAEILIRRDVDATDARVNRAKL